MRGWQFYLLLLALGLWRNLLGQHQQASDDWSLQLLQRYLLADPSVGEGEANLATLEDMCKIIGMIMESFNSPEEASFHAKAARLRRKSEPPSKLHPDLVPALAWEYGRIFVKGWRDMLRIRRYISANSRAAAAQLPSDTPSAPP